MSDTKKPNDQENESTVEVKIKLNGKIVTTVAGAFLNSVMALDSALGVLQGALRGAEKSAKKSPDTEGLSPFFKDTADSVKQVRTYIRPETKPTQQDSSPKTEKKEPAQP